MGDDDETMGCGNSDERPANKSDKEVLTEKMQQKKMELCAKIVEALDKNGDKDARQRDPIPCEALTSRILGHCH